MEQTTMENMIFYTFSTIPQVLAGSIALLGVFCLYRIQEYNNSLKGKAESFLIEFKSNPKNTTDKIEHLLVTRLEKAIAKKSGLEMKKWMKEIVYQVKTKSFDEALSEFDTEFDLKNTFIKRTKFCIVVTITVTALSLIPIALIQLIIVEGYVGLILFKGITITGFILCWIGWIILKSLPLDKEMVIKN